jgi:membrane-associated HD superfamily phosphohydrolase
MVRLLSVAALVFIGMATVAAAQSLGDVAKKEEQRRKTVKSSGKVYTNDELKTDPTPSVPASAATGTTSTPSASSTPAPAPAPAPSDKNADKDDGAGKDGGADKSDEKTWRKRIANARESLQRSQAFADALQSQLNALSTDFVNRDDPIQRQQIANKRDGVVAELDRVKKEVASQTKAISEIQEEARRAGVPAGWVR